MGPLEMLYGWQAVLCAATCVGFTQLVKAIVDTIYEAKWRKMEAAAKAKLEADAKKTAYRKNAKVKGGTIARKQSVAITRFLLPMTPILVGFLYANLVPLRPETLAEYVAEHVDDGWAWGVMAWGAWGAACGQFSNYLYDRLKKTLRAVAQRSMS